jgi:hypothetical protein
MSIRSPGAGGVKLTKTPEQVSIVEVAGTEPGERKYHIAITNVKCLKSFVMKDEIVFSTGKVLEPEIRIPVTGLVVKAGLP